MRVSSLSDERIIALVSDYFVPTWLSRDSYQLGKPNREELALVGKLDADRKRKKFVGGAVCVYIVTAEGAVLAALPVQKASKPDQLSTFLRKVVDEEKLAVRAEEARKASAAPPPAKPQAQSKDGLLFTLRTRFDGKGVNRGNSRDVIELSEKEWKAILPRAKASEGHSWTIPEKTAHKLLQHTYPPLPHWNASHGKMEECVLKGKILSVNKDEVRFRLEGNLSLLFPHQGKPTDGKVTARLAGFATTKSGQLTSLQLVSEDGEYAQSWQGKARKTPMSFAMELER
jgi:hypothetical protein